MYKQSFRAAAFPLARAAARQPASRRFINTAPPHRTSRSWRSSAVRWGLAGALVYYYNTSSVFAEEPAYAVHAPPDTGRETPETYPTIDAVAEQRRTQAQRQAASSPTQTASVAAPDAAGALAGGPEDLEQEASQQGAFNEETGEINWDCPCLGGMADGPCGEQFKAAFSCFVYSKDEPKGVDCIEHFKTMQNCFREHPEIYGAELEDDEVAAATEIGGDGQGPLDASRPAPMVASEAAEPPRLQDMGSPQHGGGEKVNVHRDVAPDSETTRVGQTERSQAATQQVAWDHGDGASESDSALPKAAHDAR